MSRYMLPYPSESHGLTMIELLVGMVIAMLSTLIIMQVYEGFEGQKRTTTGGADAQTNASIALHNIQRDVSSSGYGLPLHLKTTDQCSKEYSCAATDTPDQCWLKRTACFAGSPPMGKHSSALNCDPVPTIDHDSSGATPNVGIFPVLLQDGGTGAGASDTIIVTYGDTAMGGLPVFTGSVSGNAVFMGVDPLNPTEANNMTCAVGDVALLVSGRDPPDSSAACELTKVATLTGTTGATLNPAPTVVNSTLIPAARGISFTCLGNLNEFTYAVANNTLMRNGAANVAGIVAIQAQYGISASTSSNTVSQWVNPTGVWALTKAGSNLVTPALADRKRIKAIRVAVVARSGLWEKDVVSTACSSTTTPNPTGVCAWEGSALSPAPVINLLNDPEWQHYRYRVYETIIPVRNVLWSYDAL